jgi:drug/metabolite transporter (DMT)-like permease
MVAIGGLLALACGVLHSVAAALQKREGQRSGHGVEGVRQLVVLAHRRWWLASLAVSALGWLAEAASLAIAPVAVVATARGAGRGLLVVLGRRWLGERFGRLEIGGVALALGGSVLVALGVVGSPGTPASPPLPVVTLFGVGILAALAAAVVARWRSGVGLGAAVGLLFAATSVYTKELGDRVAHLGPGAAGPILASPALWIMVAFTVWSQGLLQDAYRRASAAAVAAAVVTVSAIGLVAAGVVLYHQALAPGVQGGLLVGGIVLALGGVAVLSVAGARATTIAAPPGPSGPHGDGPTVTTAAPGGMGGEVPLSSTVGLGSCAPLNAPTGETLPNPAAPRAGGADRIGAGAAPTP